MILELKVQQYCDDTLLFDTDDILAVTSIGIGYGLMLKGCGQGFKIDKPAYEEILKAKGVKDYGVLG